MTGQREVGMRYIGANMILIQVQCYDIGWLWEIHVCTTSTLSLSICFHKHKIPSLVWLSPDLMWMWCLTLVAWLTHDYMWRLSASAIIQPLNFHIIALTYPCFTVVCVYSVYMCACMYTTYKSHDDDREFKNSLYMEYIIIYGVDMYM